MGLKQIRCTICNWLRIREQCNLIEGSVRRGVRARIIALLTAN